MFYSFAQVKYKIKPDVGYLQLKLSIDIDIFDYEIYR